MSNNVLLQIKYSSQVIRFCTRKVYRPSFSRFEVLFCIMFVTILSSSYFHLSKTCCVVCSVVFFPGCPIIGW